jgi:site-specific DNA recombinase
MKRAVIYLRVSTSAQADTDLDPQGYSLPAQREACSRKAAELGADVVREFVDRGESARSADRPALQELLSWVEAEGDVDYCIVHKVDRWARNRHDDVLMDLALRAAATQLVSATESIDETPSGMLVRGIMASIAEFYSRNLATEAMKGMHQKAKVGGTPGKAPIGYLNIRQRIDGREIRTVAVDPERAPLIQWAFAAYASGEWTTRALWRELTDRGLRTVPRPTRPPAPLQLSNVAKILTNRYYLGYVTFLGVEYEGRHDPLIAPSLFQRVQVMLKAKATAEERHWRHQHYLKGSLFCGRCGARLSLQWAKGRYLYFFCLGRQRGSGCEQPYVVADVIEEEVVRHYEVIQFEPDRVAFLRRRLGEEIEARRRSARRVVAREEKRVTKLEAERRRYARGVVDETIPADIAREEQQRIARAIAKAHAVLAEHRLAFADVERVLTQAIDLAASCADAYRAAGPKVRRLFNQVFFDKLFVDSGRIVSTKLAEPIAGLMAYDIADRAEAVGQRKYERKAKNPDLVLVGQSSSKTDLVEVSGPEPPTSTLRT